MHCDGQYHDNKLRIKKNKFCITIDSDTATMLMSKVVISRVFISIVAVSLSIVIQNFTYIIIKCHITNKFFTVISKVI